MNTHGFQKLTKPLLVDSYGVIEGFARHKLVYKPIEAPKVATGLMAEVPKHAEEGDSDDRYWGGPHLTTEFERLLIGLQPESAEKLEKLLNEKENISGGLITSCIGCEIDSSTESMKRKILFSLTVQLYSLTPQEA